MIASRGCDHPRGRNIAHQKVGKGTAGLERSGMLQQFQLVNQANRAEAEIGTFDFHNRRLSDMRSNQFIRASNGLSIYGYGVYGGDFLVHNR